MSLRDIDTATWDADERRESRAAERGEPSPLDITQPGTRALAAVRDRPFVVASADEIATLDVPRDRLDTIAWLRENPNTWVRYLAAGTDRDPKSPKSIYHLVNRAAGGFTTGFEATVRQRGTVVFLRYVDPGRGNDE